MLAELDSQRRRRDEWYRLTREQITRSSTADGTARILQFGPAYREPVWILPALYTGDASTSNWRTIWCPVQTRGADQVQDISVEYQGKQFGIFQSNAFAHCRHRFDKLLTPAARR